MRRLCRGLVCLYPAWWRRRYARELEALIDECDPGWTAALDLAQGAIVMQMRHVLAIPIIAAAAAAGALVGAVVHLRTPALFTSSSIVRLTGVDALDSGSASAVDLRDALARAAPAPHGRAATSVVLVDARADSAVVKISHAATDSSAAQEAVQALTRAAIGEGAAAGRGVLVEEATLATTAERADGGRTIAWAGGAGLLVGAVVVGMRRAVDRLRLRTSTS